MHDAAWLGGGGARAGEEGPDCFAAGEPAVAVGGDDDGFARGDERAECGADRGDVRVPGGEAGGGGDRGVVCGCGGVAFCFEGVEGRGEAAGFVPGAGDEEEGWFGGHGGWGVGRMVRGGGCVGVSGC